MFSLLGPCSVLVGELKYDKLYGAAFTHPTTPPPKASIPSSDHVLLCLLLPSGSNHCVLSFTWISSVLSCCLPAATHSFFFTLFLFLLEYDCFNIYMVSTWHESSVCVCVCVCLPSCASHPHSSIPPLWSSQST